MANETTYILMDAQDPCEWEEVTLDGAKEFIRNQWSEWKELDEDGELVDQMTDEQIESIDSFDFEQVENALEGFDYRIFNSQQERRDWFEELQLDYIED